MRVEFKRGFGAGAVALAAFMLMAAPAVHAGEWIADATSGCQVWDPNPQLNESVAWSGACANGRAEGKGTAQWRQGGTALESDEGSWHDGRQVGQGVQTWPGGRYQGDLSAGEPNGQGVLTLQKLRYDGEFHDGKPNGAGTLTDGGKTVQGTWKDGCLQDTQRKASIGVPLSACR